jgi:hypothetical protein
VPVDTPDLGVIAFGFSHAFEPDRRSFQVPVVAMATATRFTERRIQSVGAAPDHAACRWR